MTPGERVRTLVEVLASDNAMLPIGTSGTVLGHEGDRVIVSFEDQDAGTTRQATCEVWELYRPRSGRPA